MARTAAPGKAAKEHNLPIKWKAPVWGQLKAAAAEDARTSGHPVSVTDMIRKFVAAGLEARAARAREPGNADRMA